MDQVAERPRPAQVSQMPAQSSAVDPIVARFDPAHERQRAIAAAEELANFCAWSWHLSGTAVQWYGPVQRILGLDPDAPALDRTAYLERIHPQDREQHLSVIEETLSSGQEYRSEHRFMRADGEVRDIVSRGRAERDACGNLIRLVGSFQDVTDVNAAARELQRSRDLFSGVLDAAVEQSIIATDPNGIITVFNAGAERLLGYRAADMLGRTCEFLHDDAEMQAWAAELGVEPGVSSVVAALAAGESHTRRWTYITMDGRRLQMSVSITAMRGAGGELTGYIKVGNDITQWVREQDARRSNDRLIEEIFRFAPSGMLLISLGGAPGRLLRVNPALCRLTGYSESELLAMTVEDLTAPDDRRAHRQRLAEYIENGGDERSVERRWIRADGSELWVQLTVSPRTVQDDPYLIGQVQDISEQRAAKARLTHQALHDSLTGLPNRVLMMDRLEHALATASRTQENIAVLYVDLDGFKAVNDNAGHAAGDQLLIEVAARLSTAVRPGDTVARIGGDEFVVIAEKVPGPAAADRIAERILTALRLPFLHQRDVLEVSASVGVCVAEGHGTAESLLQASDQAMYRAKQSGKDAFRTVLVVSPSAAGSPADRRGRLTPSPRAT